MTDTNELRNLIDEKGLKYGFIAEKLGITTFTLQKKIDNNTEFKSSEIKKLCVLLEIDGDLEKKEKIFFAEKVDL